MPDQLKAGLARIRSITKMPDQLKAGLARIRSITKMPDQLKAGPALSALIAQADYLVRLFRASGRNRRETTDKLIQ
jgi:hypothetical protein